jgi:5-methylcytosine-specific restriction endonuclease McrA
MPKTDWEGFAFPKGQHYRRNDKAYKELRAWVFAIDSYTCVICRMYNDRERLHMHHRKTKGSGGEDSISNCYTVCDRCHREIDNNKEFIDWETVDERRKKIQKDISG